MERSIKILRVEEIFKRKKHSIFIKSNSNLRKFCKSNCNLRKFSKSQYTLRTACEKIS